MPVKIANPGYDRLVPAAMTEYGVGRTETPINNLRYHKFCWFSPLNLYTRMYSIARTMTRTTNQTPWPRSGPLCSARARRRLRRALQSANRLHQRTTRAFSNACVVRTLAVGWKGVGGPADRAPARLVGTTPFRRPAAPCWGAGTP